MSNPSRQIFHWLISEGARALHPHSLRPLSHCLFSRPRWPICLTFLRRTHRMDLILRSPRLIDHVVYTRWVELDNTQRESMLSLLTRRSYEHLAPPLSFVWPVPTCFFMQNKAFRSSVSKTRTDTFSFYFIAETAYFTHLCFS